MKFRKFICFALTICCILTAGVALTACDKNKDKNATYYTVTFNSDGGSSVGSARVKKNSTVARPADPTKEGFTFVNWFEGEESALPFDFSTQITSNLTLYARWTDNVLGFFRVKEGEQNYTIQRYIGGAKQVTVPSVYNDKPIVLAAGAFAAKDVEEVALSEGITRIPQQLFGDCASLTKVNILGAVTEVGTRAFENCRKLNSIVLPEGLLTIGQEAFDTCESLESIVIPNSVTELGKSAFACCKKLSSITLSSGMTTLKESTFYGCSALKSLVLPEGIIAVEEDAFSDLTEEVSLPATLQTLPVESGLSSSRLTTVRYNGDIKGFLSIEGVGRQFENAKIFLGETELSGEVVIPADISSIREYAFANQQAISAVTFSEGLISIGDAAFENTRLSSVSFPATLASIGQDAFLGAHLTAVEFKGGNVEIEEDAFGLCSGITSVNVLGTIDTYLSLIFANESSNPACFAKTLTLNGEPLGADVVVGDVTQTINAYAFKSFTGLNSVTLSESVTAIGASAFENSTIATIDTRNVATIGNDAFSGCTQLANLTLGEALTSVGAAAFKNCSSLTEVVIPSLVEVLPSELFMKCTKLETVTINGPIRTVGNAAFKGCLLLDSLSFSVGLESIGAEAFADCRKLTSCLLPAGVNEIGDRAFYMCFELAFMSVPASVEKIGEYGFYRCLALETLILNDGLREIGAYAFCGCTDLLSVTIPSTVETIGAYAFCGDPSQGTINTITEFNINSLAVYNALVSGDAQVCGGILIASPLSELNIKVLKTIVEDENATNDYFTEENGWEKTEDEDYYLFRQMVVAEPGESEEPGIGDETDANEEVA